MSLPFYKVICSGCGFTGGISYGVRYEYKGLPEHEPDLQNAWCQACDKIVKYFSPYTRKDAEWIISDLNDSITRNQGWFSRFSKTKKNEIKDLEKQLQAVKLRIQYFCNNPFKSLCLDCGSQHVFPFEMPDAPYDEYGVYREVNIKHSCGGQLSVSMEGRLSFSGQKKVVYDEVGTILYDDRTKNG